MTEVDPHNYRKVGYSMIIVAASLVVIAILYLAIGDDVLYSDRIGKQKQLEYQQSLEQKQNIGKATGQGNNLSINLREDVNLNAP